MLKQYVGLIRDHSASMGHLGSDAMKDYNDNIHALQSESFKSGIQTITNVIECGVGSRGEIIHSIKNYNIVDVPSIRTYRTDGHSTALFDSVGQMIDVFKEKDKYEFNRDGSSYLIVATTDGENNRTYDWNAYKLANEIKRLQATDKWTFVFRVPQGYKKDLVKMLGVDLGNVMEWEQTSHGVEVSTHAMQASYGAFYAGRNLGINASGAFFVEGDTVSTSQLVQTLVDIPWNQIMQYQALYSESIKAFVERETNQAYRIGSAYYELIKTETLQPNKDILIDDLTSGRLYRGQDSVRILLNLPQQGHIRITPKNSNFNKVYVQSTSVNRKLEEGQKVIVLKG